MIMRTVKDQPITTWEEFVNDIKAETLGPQSLSKQQVTHYTRMDSPLLKKAHVEAHLKFANEHLMIQRRLGRKCCGQMRPKLSSLASTQLVVFGGREMLIMTPRIPSLQSSTEVETLQSHWDS